MFNRHAFRIAFLLCLIAVPVTSVAADRSTLPSQTLAGFSAHADAQRLVAVLLLFIPWEDPPTPPPPDPNAKGKDTKSTDDPGDPNDPGDPGDPNDPGDPGDTHHNPEPATLVTGLVGGGLLMLAGLRRRRWARA